MKKIFMLLAAVFVSLLVKAQIPTAQCVAGDTIVRQGNSFG